ncbi:oxygen-independent coproporphyrinogen III oxidase [Dysgonomonas sp. Marseille-P4677]|uniref:oxygen-independent coproporphyrinogen III oxidase n=1 Tax=Dysgonomonas sp. Marseille-P4677 TaxID=2364790 RepID=UPI001912F820|nr:oxygen-independent coproporphyrinogen III oxidase [Dysgonomonas sp. Marseille-P4677]MBK5722397.1 oxygen-independent coproporphyrinogen III oxidase [Dysgonomonas sp. Marseille-P4677]
MKQELLNKYSIPVPRYTSYPPANFFNESFTENKYRQAVIESNNQNPQHISIYIHIPFCYHMCYYCGCNSQLLKNDKVVSDYIDALKKEIRMTLPLLDHNRKISQIHYGGGTPTSQPVSVLKELNQLVLSEFNCIENLEIAIECHPGYADEAYWNDLIDAGFNRISLGVQDFNEDVLKASNRKAPRMPIEDIFKILKNRRISVNMDFIYGLPLQSVESFTKTINKAIALKPDRIVTFSYAHVPWVNELQKKLENVGLPSIEIKSKIYETAKQQLNNAGYKTIGLDHFVLPNDELYEAQQSKALHRNFQGYCTRRTTGQVYAFGITGISQLATAYSQNTKDLKTYIEQVNEGIFPIAKGYILNEEEQITREVISRLMCNYTINWQNLSNELNISADKIKSTIGYNEIQLQEFANDGIIEYDNNALTVLSEAAPFVRNVAASFDRLLGTKENRYSKSI